jgi:mRNA-degrading endonuclease RelE of RelBE toxin-antitoxin system
MNRSISRFLDDLDKRDEERREDLIKTLKDPKFEEEEENKTPMSRKENIRERNQAQ